MIVRLATVGVPQFRHASISVGAGWSVCRIAEDDTDSIACLRNYVGRFLRIHPDDAGELAKVGLALRDGTVVEQSEPAEEGTENAEGTEPPPSDEGEGGEGLDTEEPAEEGAPLFDGESPAKRKKGRR